MKKFIFKLLIFAAPLVIAAYPIDILLSSRLSKSHDSPGELEVMRDIYQGNIDADIAIYGSSRAWVNIDPQIIEDSLKRSTYNFGIDGHNLWLQYYRHLEYLSYNKPPSTIILSVDVFTLIKRADLYQPHQFLPHMLWNRKLFAYTHSYEGYRYYDYLIPLVRYIGKRRVFGMIRKVAATGDTAKKFRYKGFKGMEWEWNGDFEKAKAKNKSYEIKLDKNSIGLLEKFIRECEKAKIELILVYTPEYIEGHSYVSNRSEIIMHYEALCRKYNLLFFDFSDDEICLDKKFFYNANHLNRRGATEFTRKLVNKLATQLQYVF